MTVNHLIPVIAIDGSSASGKGTVAEGVAATLGFHHLDSGALYRLVALAAMNAGISLNAEAELTKLAQSLDVRFKHGDIWLKGEPVTEDIRTEVCGNAASQIAVFPAVRLALIDFQRSFRRQPGLVADGRDMGSVIFPDAQLKIFLTASAEERARRRYKQLIDKGMCVTLDAVLHDIQQRDARDSGRAVAPLQKRDDASLLDTTALGISESIAEVLSRYKKIVAH